MTKERPGDSWPSFLDCLISDHDDRLTAKDMPCASRPRAHTQTPLRYDRLTLAIRTSRPCPDVHHDLFHAECADRSLRDAPRRPSGH